MGANPESNRQTLGRALGSLAEEAEDGGEEPEGSGTPQRTWPTESTGQDSRELERQGLSGSNLGMPWLSSLELWVS